MSVAESLKQLETALLNTPVPTLEQCHAEDPNYAQQYKAFRTIIDQANIQSDVLSGHLLGLLEAHSPSKELKVLSVGCGDGFLDNMILSKVLASSPTATINYTGLDINPQFCTESEERLQHLPIAKKFICENFDKWDVDKLETYDFIQVVHVHYYFQQLQSAFLKMRQLLSNKGRCVVLGAQSGPVIQLIAQFWKHEGKQDFWTMNYVVEALEEMRIPYQLQDVYAEIDLSSCFKDNWTSNISRFVLDFLCGTKMSEYPDNITKLCIAYLAAAVSGGSNKFAYPLHRQAVCFKAQG